MKILRSVVWGTLLGAAALFAVVPTQAQVKTHKHAFVRVAQVVAAPVVHPKRTLKETFGVVVFAAENVVDVVHGGLGLADKAFDALSIQGKIPVLDSVYGFVSAAEKDTRKLDYWLERQEDLLFGTHN